MYHNLRRYKYLHVRFICTKNTYLIQIATKVNIRFFFRSVYMYNSYAYVGMYPLFALMLPAWRSVYYIRRWRWNCSYLRYRLRVSSFRLVTNSISYTFSSKLLILFLFLHDFTTNIRHGKGWFSDNFNFCCIIYLYFDISNFKIYPVYTSSFMYIISVLKTSNEQFGIFTSFSHHFFAPIWEWNVITVTHLYILTKI